MVHHGFGTCQHYDGTNKFIDFLVTKYNGQYSGHLVSGFKLQFRKFNVFLAISDAVITSAFNRSA